MKCNPNTIHQQLHTFGKGGECQVLDEVFGWGGFRSSYDNDTWTWLIAALDPNIHLMLEPFDADIHWQDPHVQCQPGRRVLEESVW